MKRKDFNGKKIIFILSFFIFTGTLFALDMPKVDQNAIFALLQKKDVDIQSLYDDMSDLIPAIVYLQPNYTSGIDLELVKKVDFEIKNQMITSMTFKPVTMNKWLDSNYGTKKALSIYRYRCCRVDRRRNRSRTEPQRNYRYSHRRPSFNL